MGKGNPLIRVDSEFKQIVDSIQRKANQTSAEVTRGIARQMKKYK